MFKLKSAFLAFAFAITALCGASQAYAQTATPFDLAQLRPEVRAAVVAARDAQRRAMGTAARAHAPVDGLIRFEGTAGDDYSGECSPCGELPQRHGYGVLSWDDGELYAGGHMRGGNGGMKHGHGVYVFVNGNVYEGQFSADQFNGYAAAWNADGTLRYQGRYLNNQPAD